VAPWGPRRLLVAAAALALATAAIVAFVDVPLSRACARVAPDVITAITGGLRVVEAITLLDLGRFALGLGLAGLGLLALLWRVAVGRALIYIGVSHSLTWVVVGWLKTAFGRHRPSEIPFDPSFFQPGGVSFPSGHGAHVFPLFFTLLAVWPLGAWTFLPIALYVGAARVVPNKHFLGDVTGTMVVAAVIAAALWPIYRGTTRFSSARTTGKSPSASSQKSLAK
jgi:membrane-associated phospholipid phosphatase